MWAMSNKIPPRINSGFNSINNSPFGMMKRSNPNINKINVICDGKPIKQMNSINDNQINNSPFQFDVIYILVILDFFYTYSSNW